MSEKCPKCGAARRSGGVRNYGNGGWWAVYTCKSREEVFDKTGPKYENQREHYFREEKDCLRNRIATLKAAKQQAEAERDELIQLGENLYHILTEVPADPQNKAVKAAHLPKGTMPLTAWTAAVIRIRKAHATLEAAKERG
jgi:hypothetical protein